MGAARKIEHGIIPPTKEAHRHPIGVQCRFRPQDCARHSLYGSHATLQSIAHFLPGCPVVCRKLLLAETRFYLLVVCSKSAHSARRRSGISKCRRIITRLSIPAIALKGCAECRLFVSFISSCQKHKQIPCRQYDKFFIKHPIRAYLKLVWSDFAEIVILWCSET